MKTITAVTFAFILAVAMGSLAWGGTDSPTTAMMKSLRAQVMAHAKLDGTVKSFVNKNLVPNLNNEVFVNSTLEQNAKKVPLAKIQRIDNEWKAAEEELPIQTQVTSNQCAQTMTTFAKANSAVLEAFVMDDQGAVVCEYGLTSDYWQGDEAKWKNSFNGGKGGVDVGKIKFDKSANANLQQVSLPIIAQGGKVIGAVTFGIVVDKL